MGSGWPTLAIISLLLVGLHPFTYTSLATSFDGLLHLYRLVELDHLIAQGIFFPRWAPDFVWVKSPGNPAKIKILRSIRCSAA